MAKTEHGPGVLDGRKGRKGLGADALAGRVRGDQVRVLLFEGAELAHQGVVLVIRDYRIVEHVVAMIVEIEGALELGVAFGGVG